MIGEGLFRSLQRENRLLSSHLEHPFPRPLFNDIRKYDMQALTVADPADLAGRLIADVRVAPPTLGGTRSAQISEHEGPPRTTESRSLRHSTTRFYVAIEISGDHELLSWWPDQEDNGTLTAIDEPPQPAVSDPIRHHLAQHRDEQWRVQHQDNDGEQVALYTFIDLTAEEVHQIGEELPSVRSIVDDERSRIEPIVAAIGHQTEQFFDDVLPEMTENWIRDRIRWLEKVQAVTDDLTWPVGFKFSPPIVEDSAIDADDDVEGGTIGNEITLPFRDRLAPATFDDMMRTVRIWGSAVERYPAAFGSLAEERLSDLLAATLNAALPGAQREVYTRAGKSDIYVHADAIDDGRSHARVFIGECKWWDGPATITGAYQQLWEYLEVKDTFAMLLMFSTRIDFTNVRDGARDALTAAGLTETDLSPIENWPYLTAVQDHRNVTICVATLDLPPPK